MNDREILSIYKADSGGQNSELISNQIMPRNGDGEGGVGDGDGGDGERDGDGDDGDGACDGCRGDCDDYDVDGGISK